MISWVFPVKFAAGCGVGKFIPRSPGRFRQAERGTGGDAAGQEVVPA